MQNTLMQKTNCEVVSGTYLFPEISPEEYLENPVKILNTKGSYVEPDLMIICDKTNIQIVEERVFGVPRFILEILSQSTGIDDLTTKKELYQRCGVEEYIIVDPKNKLIRQFILKDKTYIE